MGMTERHWCSTASFQSSGSPVPANVSTVVCSVSSGWRRRGLAAEPAASWAISFSARARRWAGVSPRPGSVGSTARLVSSRSTQLVDVFVDDRLELDGAGAGQVEVALQVTVERLGQEEAVALVGWFGAVGIVAVEPELDDLDQLVGGQLPGVADEHGLVPLERLGGPGVQRSGQDAGVGLGDRRRGEGDCGLRHDAQLAGQEQSRPGGGAAFAGAGGQPVGHRRGRIGPVRIAGLEVGGEGADHRAQADRLLLQANERCQCLLAVEVVGLDGGHQFVDRVDGRCELFEHAPEHEDTPAAGSAGKSLATGARGSECADPEAAASTSTLSN